MDLKKLSPALLILLSKSDSSFVPQAPSQSGWRTHLQYGNNGFDENQRFENQKTKDSLFYQEVVHDPKNALRYLIAGADPNLTNSQNGNSLLHEIAQGKKDIGVQMQLQGLAEHFVKFGANTKLRNYEGLTPSQLARRDDNNVLANAIENAEKNKHIHLFDSSRSLQAIAITSQKIDLVTDPTDAIDLLVTSMYNGLNVEESYAGNDTPLNIAKKNWPKEQSDALHAMSACVNTTIDFLDKLYDKNENLGSNETLQSDIKKQIQEAWKERINPLIKYNNYERGQFR
ncbi:MAG: hypothetical protein COV35_10590 [Alphaproteobacteria bacterium CG11_big_fil_rev_8_21_14_0_20_39_49]|nr:MAG: hypothetical protein COV35_10590 [Alphaproteobacteria bacterium CG11_big_fil_rev_8_21_14_0_20_39_49]